MVFNSTPDQTWDIKAVMWVGKVLLFVPALAIMLLVTPLMFARTWFKN